MFKRALYQSDVVGSNGLASGTVDANYAPAIAKISAEFYRDLGIGAIVTRDGKQHAVANAQPGILTSQKARGMDLSALHVPTENLNTIGDSSGHKFDSTISRTKASSGSHDDRTRSR